MLDPTEKFRITSLFGKRTAPTAGASTNHNGIDLATPVGTPVKAPLDGIVTVVNTTPNGGKQLIVKLDNGLTVGFAHLSEQLKNVGDKVKQGEIIARTGNTGTGTGAHLHFTVTENGQKIDPLTYFYV